MVNDKLVADLRSGYEADEAKAKSEATQEYDKLKDAMARLEFANRYGAKSDLSSELMAIMHDLREAADAYQEALRHVQLAKNNLVALEKALERQG